MAESVGVASAVVGFAGTLYTSIQTLYDVINTWVNAPQTLRELHNSIKVFQGVLTSLTTELEARTHDNSPLTQLAAYKDLEPVLRGCQKSCDEFTSLLQGITSHSDEDRVSKRDRLRVHLNEKEISLFKTNLEVYKSTLTIALQHTTIKNIIGNGAAIQELQDTITTFVAQSAGRVEGLEIARHTLAVSGVNPTQQDLQIILNVLDNHEMALKQCLKVCKNAAEDTKSLQGVNVKSVKALERAIQQVGNIGIVGDGGPAVRVDMAVASGDATQQVGNMDGNAWETMLKIRSRGQ